MEDIFEPQIEEESEESVMQPSKATRKEFAAFLSESSAKLKKFETLDLTIPLPLFSTYEELKKKGSKNAQILATRYENYLKKAEEHNQTVAFINETIDSFDTLAFLEKPRSFKKETRQKLSHALDELLSFSFETDQRIAGFLYCVSLIDHHYDELILQRDILNSFEKNLSDVYEFDGYIDQGYALEAKSKELILKTMIDCMQEAYYEFDKIIPIEEAIKTHNEIYLSDHPDFIPPQED